MFVNKAFCFTKHSLRPYNDDRAPCCCVAGNYSYVWVVRVACTQAKYRLKLVTVCKLKVSVGVGMSYGLEDCRLQFPDGVKKFISSPQHPDHLWQPMGTEGSFTMDKSDGA
jgi:hypothetical protein